MYFSQTANFITSFSLSLYIYVCTVHIYIYTYMYVLRMDVYVYVCVNIYIYIYISLSIYIYICTHTYIHVYIYNISEAYIYPCARCRLRNVHSNEQVLHACARVVYSKTGTIQCTNMLVKSYQSSSVIAQGVSRETIHLFNRRLVTTCYCFPIVAEQEHVVQKCPRQSILQLARFTKKLGQYRIRVVQIPPLKLYGAAVIYFKLFSRAVRLFCAMMCADYVC